MLEELEYEVLGRFEAVEQVYLGCVNSFGLRAGQTFSRGGKTSPEKKGSW